MHRFRPRLTYANVVATLALFVAVGGGTAFAVVAANQVNSASIIDGQVKTRDLAAGAVRSPKIADGTVTSNDLKNGDVKNADIAANAVGSANVLDNSLGGADISDGSLTGNDLSADSISGAQIDESTLAGIAPPWFAVVNDLGGTGTVYARLLGESTATTDSGFAKTEALPPAGGFATVTRLHVLLPGTTLATGQSRKFTVELGGIASALSCTISAGSGECTSLATVHPLPSQFIRIRVESSTTGAALTATQDAHIAVVVQA